MTDRPFPLTPPPANQPLRGRRGSGWVDQAGADRAARFVPADNASRDNTRGAAVPAGGQPARVTAAARETGGPSGPSAAVNVERTVTVVAGSQQAATRSDAAARGGESGSGERSGFPAGARATIIPNLFFSTVLPRIEEPAELVVSTYLFYALGRRRGYPRVITYDELAAEAPLRKALGRLDGGIEASLRRGLELAVLRGTILRAQRRPERVGGPTIDLYLINTETARGMLAAGQLAGVELSLAPLPLPDESPPSIFALYEENIGTIAPLIAEQMREVEAEYPMSWIVAAFREAVSLNKRNWRYIVRILERWRAEGRTDATLGRDLSKNSRGRDLEGRYRNLVRR